jgi:hypothetical protein
MCEEGMFRSSLTLLIAFVLGCLTVGCGGPGSIPVEQPDNTPAEAIKRDLQSTIANGSLGSEMYSIEQNLDKLDAAKAAELRKDLAELQKTTDPAQVKAKAQAMIDKL